MRPATEKLGTVDGSLGVLALGLKRVELGTVGSEVCAEGFNALGCLFRLGRVEFVFCEVGIRVNCAGEGGQGRGNLTMYRRRTRGRVCGEGFKVFADG